ncbi:MAG TPA: histidine kinase, partial [Chryseosolibacter sp.]|nr:histidine kinase [Chryseosolibacter sp.]
ISDISVLNDTMLLFSTTGNGFIVYNTANRKSNHYHAGNNFIANNIYSILKKDSLLWIGTEKGLAVTSVASLLVGKPRYRFLNKSSGLGSNIVNFLADGGRAIWAFSDDGFSVIPDTITRFAGPHPVFYIKSLESNHKRLNPAEATVLDPDGNNLKISFGFISFNNNSVLLRYKILDDAVWQKTEDDMLELIALAPGEYSLRIQYSPDNINWYDCFEPRPITVLPPWHKRWYVAPTAGLLALLLGYLYFRHQRSIYRQKHHYLRIINEHQQKLLQSEVVTLERERNRIAKELHDGVGTTLTAIKLRVGQLLRQHQDPTADEIEDQFQGTVTELKNIIYGLTPPSLERYGLFTALRNYVNKIQKNLPARISLKTYGYEVSNYELNLMSFRIIQELISNSIKHSSAKNLSIHVSCFHDLISIIYEDDGIGFKYDPERNGLGLDSIESRIHSIQGTLKFDSGDFGISYNIEIPLPKKKEAP